MADPIFNLSSRKLNETESQLLSKGLKYGIKAKKVDKFEILARFEELAASLYHLPIYKKYDPLIANLDNKSNLFRQLQVSAEELEKTYNYEMAKYLDEILKPIVFSAYILKDTYDFVLSLYL